MKLTGAEILIECLLEQGVDTIFGYPGGAVLNIYDALYKYQDKISHILTSISKAQHAADGYARASEWVYVLRHQGLERLISYEVYSLYGFCPPCCNYRECSFKSSW